MFEKIKSLDFVNKKDLWKFKINFLNLVTRYNWSKKKYINHAKLGLINDGAVIANYYFSRG